MSRISAAEPEPEPAEPTVPARNGFAEKNRSSRSQGSCAGGLHNPITGEMPRQQNEGAPGSESVEGASFRATARISSRFRGDPPRPAG